MRESIFVKHATSYRATINRLPFFVEKFDGPFPLFKEKRKKERKKNRHDFEQFYGIYFRINALIVCEYCVGSSPPAIILHPMIRQLYLRQFKLKFVLISPF